MWERSERISRVLSDLGNSQLKQAIERFMSGKGNPSFPDKGDRSHQVLLFGKDVVKFQSMWFLKEPDNPEMIQALLSKLGGSKAK